MTLKAIFANGARYALNEITGQMIELYGNGWQHKNLIPGDTILPNAMLSLLFDESHIDSNWSPLPNCEARARFARYQQSFEQVGCSRHHFACAEDLCGCITVNRL